jgi:hypothetical protein
VVNWLERARLEFSKMPDRGTANTAERNLTSVTAVPHQGKSGNFAERIQQQPGREIDPEHEKAIREHLEERAAIQEYDGGLPREQAEAEARRNLKVFEFRLSDDPAAWCVMIAPGCTLEGVTQDLRDRYGERLLAVRDYRR